MGNLNDKGVKIHRKKFKVLTRKLYPAGVKAYLVKRSGRTQSFTTLAIFNEFGIEFDKFRHSETIEFAVLPTDTFALGDETKSMRFLAQIADHIALVTNDESILYTIRDGDEFQPFYLDFTWKFYIRQSQDLFNPAQNA